ncbi:type II secretion system protein [bacterium]|nr:type II secretion system protein [bacterium]
MVGKIKEFIGIKKEMKQRAFTLAEVLITLAIVGIIASATIPTLISNIQLGKYTSQFKKDIATLSQSAVLGQANFDLDYASAIMVSNIENCAEEAPDQTLSFCALINGTLSAKTTYRGLLAQFENYRINIPDKTYETQDTDVKLDTDMDKYIAYTLADGSLIAFNKDAYGCALPEAMLLTKEWIEQNQRCVGFIDVNGISLPNKVVNCENEDPLVLNPTSTCNVNSDPLHTTDIYPVVFHNSIVEPATPAGKFILSHRKSTSSSDKTDRNAERYTD